ncbi:ankyrin repeat domain-containing protein 34A-like [Stigmatopora argus]
MGDGGDGGGGGGCVAPPQMEGNALLSAVFQGKLRLSRLLLEGGAYINEGDGLGRTPLAAACLADYQDPGTRVRMLRYLLDGGADPNIPDKGGRTALMHACARRAGQEAVALLLAGGADPSLKDHSGRSALTRALEEGQRDTLRVLLDACRAKGKEVIIITSDTSPSGTKKTKQYLNSPPSPGGPDACMSPSDVEIATSSPAGRDERVFSFSPPPTPAPPPPRSAARPRGEKRAPAPPRKLLKRLNSEPWGLVAPSARLGPAAEGPTAPPARLGPAADGGVARLSQRMDAVLLAEPARASTSRRHSIETHEPRAAEREDRPGRAPSRRSDEVQRHRVPYSGSGEPISSGPEASGSERRPAPVPGSPEERRVFEAPPFGESVERAGRRGSGTFPLERLPHGRPPCGFLPPLKVQKGYPDGEPRKKKLTRRHSMQTEQMKQLSVFRESLAEKVSEPYGD